MLHVASPFPASSPTNEDELIRPAVDGVLSVLKACKEDGGVKRVVLTSSIAAINALYETRDELWTEEDWTDVDKLRVPYDSYLKSKTLAERAAWDFMTNLPDDKKFELAVINPGYIMGPHLSGAFSASMEVPKRLLQREMPAIPKVGFCIVDVRDVAQAHIQAMTRPDCAGHRHIVVTHPVWIKDMALVLKEEFESQGYNVPTAELPNFMIKIASLFDRELKTISPGLGNQARFDSSRMKNVLGIPGREIKSTLLDMAYAMIEAGFIKKTAGYTGPKFSEEK